MWGWPRTEAARDGADVTGRLWPDKGCSGFGSGRSGLGRRPWTAGQELLDLDGDLVAADNDRALGHGQVIGQDADLVLLGGVEFDDGAAAEAQHLMDRHGGGAKHNRDIDRYVVKMRHFAPNVLSNSSLWF